MRYTILLAGVLCILTASAQQNYNDDCADAPLLNVSPTNVPTEWTMAHMHNAATAITPAACTGSGFRDVWFKFTATAPKHHLLCGGPVPGPSRLEAFNGTCGTLIQH